MQSGGELTNEVGIEIDVADVNAFDQRRFEKRLRDLAAQLVTLLGHDIVEWDVEYDDSQTCFVATCRNCMTGNVKVKPKRNFISGYLTDNKCGAFSYDKV